MSPFTSSRSAPNSKRIIGYATQNKELSLAFLFLNAHSEIVIYHLILHEIFEIYQSN